MGPVTRRPPLREPLRRACLLIAMVYAAAHLPMLAVAVIFTLPLLPEQTLGEAVRFSAELLVYGLFGWAAILCPARLLRYPARRSDIVLSAGLGLGYCAALGLPLMLSCPTVPDSSEFVCRLFGFQSPLRFAALIIFLPVAVTSQFAMPGAPFFDPTPLAILYPIALWVGAALSLPQRPA